jgi:Flp pilus assembly protein TadG
MRVKVKRQGKEVLPGRGFRFAEPGTPRVPRLLPFHSNRAGGECSKNAFTEGNAIVEFAIVVPVFLLLILACIELAYIFNVQLTLQNSVRTAGRYAITGNHLPDPLHSGLNLSRVASITQIAQQAACGLSVSGITISSAVGGSGNAGGPGDTVTISVTSKVPIVAPLVAQFFQNGLYTATAKVSFRNEPFPPANTL